MPPVDVTEPTIASTSQPKARVWLIVLVCVIAFGGVGALIFQVSQQKARLDEEIRLQHEREYADSVRLSLEGLDKLQAEQQALGITPGNSAVPLTPPALPEVAPPPAAPVPAAPVSPSLPTPTPSRNTLVGKWKLHQSLGDTYLVFEDDGRYKITNILGMVITGLYVLSPDGTLRMQDDPSLFSSNEVTIWHVSVSGDRLSVLEGDKGAAHMYNRIF